VGTRSAEYLLLVDGLSQKINIFVVTTQRTVTKTKHTRACGQALTKYLGITNWAVQNIAISNIQQQYDNCATCLLRLVGRIVVIKFGVLLDTFVIVHPPTVRNRNVAVPAIRCCPIEHVFRFIGKCVERTFLEKQNPQLKCKYEEQETRDFTVTGTVQENTCCFF
jgi:hypothetical protein